MKKIMPIIITAAILIGGSFYGGMLYGKAKSSFAFPGSDNFQGQARNGFQKGTSQDLNAAVLNGQVIAKDEQSITLKTSDGSSKIVFFSSTTKISKTAEGTVSDIEIGKQIMATAEKNSDGSYTAKTIQLSPRVQNQ
jgi:hypothetical protein